MQTIDLNSSMGSRANANVSAGCKEQINNINAHSVIHLQVFTLKSIKIKRNCYFRELKDIKIDL